MTKSELRKIYKEKRRMLTPQQVEKFNDLILINFQKIELPFVSCIHTYLASEKLGEAETLTIMRFLEFKNPELIVLIPKIDITTGNMQHFHFHDETELMHNVFGISEPASGTTFEASDIDLVLVPLLAFDEQGFRVGYGKGFYDKFLSTCREDVIKIGLSFFDAVREIEDINQYDIPLDYCVTPQHVYEF